ncbi:unnamed protein product [Vicia faba]|uniref:Uncharacterized protein n=1 Tax=Vicia faba TaxID=3906 RepID=A0AAV0YS55_VICFA|nr:unnamed protein product [Vicia faba]
MHYVNGSLLSTPADIENENIEFYKSLVGSKANVLQGIDLPAIRNGKFISPKEAHRISCPIEDNVIWTTLNSIGDNKALGIDGYNAFLFKSSRDIVKKDDKDEILEFFETGKILLVVYCSLVALILKTPEGNTIKDMRPIACCTTIYKII